MKKILFILLCIAATISCKKLSYVVYDHPYVYIAAAGDQLRAENSTVSYRGSREVTYMFYMSTKAVDYPVTLHYTIEVGDGLQNGVDFVLDDLEGDMIFNPEDRSDPENIIPAEYEKALVIPFKSHTLSSSTNNTLTIRITKVEPAMEIGIPGPIDPETGLRKNRNVTHTILKKK